MNLKDRIWKRTLGIDAIIRRRNIIDIAILETLKEVKAILKDEAFSGKGENKYQEGYNECLEQIEFRLRELEKLKETVRG